MERLGGIVLCGGESRRMGESKAWLRCGEEHLLQRVVRVVSGVVGPVVVAGKANQPLPPLPADVGRVDDQPDQTGPLAGVASGMAALSGTCDAVCVASCDHPLLTGPFVSRLFEQLGSAPGVVPVHAGRSFPLMAVYRVSAASVAAEMMREGNLRAMEFVRRCGALEVPGDAFLDVDPTLASLVNVNDAGDYAAALETLGLRAD